MSSPNTWSPTADFLIGECSERLTQAGTKPKSPVVIVKRLCCQALPPLPPPLLVPTSPLVRVRIVQKTGRSVGTHPHSPLTTAHSVYCVTAARAWSDFGDKDNYARPSKTGYCVLERDVLL
jgi:hypothetical protein